MSAKGNIEQGDEIAKTAITNPKRTARENCEVNVSKKRRNYLEWDDYFMGTALLSAKRSKDPDTQVGACIVDKQNRIVAIGYNGFPRNCSDDEFPWSKEEGKKSLNNKNMYVVHAEANAILNSNSTTLEGTRLFTTLFPCNECAKLIIQSGIKEIYYLSDRYGSKTIYQASRRMLQAVGIDCHLYVPTQKEITINFSIESEKITNQ